MDRERDPRSQWCVLIGRIRKWIAVIGRQVSLFSLSSSCSVERMCFPVREFRSRTGKRERERYGFASFSLSLLSSFFLHYDILFCCSFFQVWRRRVCTLKPNLDLCFQFRAQLDASLYKIFGAATGRQGRSGCGGGGSFGFQ